MGELKKIKKVYGENFMKLCRDLFPTLLEQEGRLYEILSSSFSDNCKNLYEDIIKVNCEEKFKSYIYSKVDVENPEKKMIEEKTPYELLKEVGYNLTECLTEEEIQKFKKYYKPREKLCTFRGGRLDSCVVFWAVKENAEDIKREDFDNPKREDEYGTSVMGIQFNRHGRCTVSIKNRYNHTVNNPDATYGNDLDKIVPGLTKSFEKLLQRQYGLELNSSNVESFNLPGYVIANGGKYYKCNMELNGDYYCPGNIVIKNGEAIHIGKPEEGLLVDYFYIDKKNKKIKVCGDIKDTFVDALQEIKSIEVVKSEEENISRIIKIYLQDIEDPVLIGIDENNQIIEYVNKNVTIIGDEFLCYNKGITKLELPNLTQVGDEFLYWNRGLSKLEMPNLTQVGDNFLCCNKGLAKLEMPKLTRAGDCFLRANEGLTKLELLNLTQVGNCFFCENEGLTKLEMPKLTQVGDHFLCWNKKLTKLELPKLTQVGNKFLEFNEGITELELPKLTQVGDNFLSWNKGLTKLEMPKLTQVGDDFLYWNKRLAKLEMPNLTQVGDHFLRTNKGLTKLEMPNLTQVGDDLLYWNNGLTKLEMPKLTRAGDCFLRANKGLTKLKLLNLTQVGNKFLKKNERINELEVPNLTQVGDHFLYGNKGLTKLELPNLTQVGGNFLYSNRQKLKVKIITPQSIAQLDKDSKLTTTEVDAGKIIEETQNKDNTRQI